MATDKIKNFINRTLENKLANCIGSDTICKLCHGSCGGYSIAEGCGKNGKPSLIRYPPLNHIDEICVHCIYDLDIKINLDI